MSPDDVTRGNYHCLHTHDSARPGKGGQLPLASPWAKFPCPCESLKPHRFSSCPRDQSLNDAGRIKGGVLCW